MLKKQTLAMEDDTLLEVLNSQKIGNDSTASGNPEDHGDSDHIDTSAGPGETIENDQVEENADEDNTGVVINYLVIIKVQ